MQGTMSLDDIYHCRNHNVSGLYRHLPKLLDLLDSWGKLKGTQLVTTTTISKSATTKTATSIETTTTKPKWIKVNSLDCSEVFEQVLASVESKIAIATF